MSIGDLPWNFTRQAMVRTAPATGIPDENPAHLGSVGMFMAGSQEKLFVEDKILRLREPLAGSGFIAVRRRLPNLLTTFLGRCKIHCTLAAQSAEDAS